VVESTLAVHVAECAVGVDAAQWAALAAGKTIYAQRGWFAANESPDIESMYLVARTTGNDPLAILPAHLLRAPRSPHYNPARLFGGALPPSLRNETAWFPGFLGGSRGGFVNEIPLAPILGPGERTSLLRQLVGSLEALQQSHFAPGIAFMYLPTAEAVGLLEAYDGRAPLFFTAAEAAINVEWPSFDGYLEALSGKRRSAVRREIASFEASSARVRVESLADVATEIAPLVANVDAKYGRDAPVAGVEENLRRQAEQLADESVVFTCERAGRLVGCALFYRCASGLFARCVGFDYALAHRGGDYFNLLLYRPLRYAIEHGLAQLHLGTAGYEAKLLRGAKPRPLWSLVYRSGWDDADARERASVWSSEQVSAFRRRYEPLILGELDADVWRVPRGR
jgi:uncharacterized protein